MVDFLSYIRFDYLQIFFSCVFITSQFSSDIAALVKFSWYSERFAAFNKQDMQENMKTYSISLIQQSFTLLLKFIIRLKGCFFLSFK